MQPPTAPPRDTLTEAQVVALIQDTASVEFSAGADLLDMTLSVQADLTDELVGGSVSRAGFATLHGTAELQLATALDWGRAVVRPYLVMSADGVTARFNLGAYLTSTPARQVDMQPRMWQVQGYDILHRLGSSVGDAYAVAAGAAYLTAVEEILLARGFSGYVIDQSAVASVLPAARVWPLDERTTWLTVVNDLLAAVAYRGVWSDWDGRLRCEPYLSPLSRAPEWSYEVSTATSMLAPQRSRERDFFDTPNRWVAVRSNQVDEAAPVEGDGRYTYVNQSVGDSSVDARDGWVITRVLSLDVADHAALVAAAQISIDADMRISEKITASTFPNPLHWHFDRMLLTDPELGPVMDVMSTRWTLPLDGGDMTHEWNVLAV